MNNRRTVTSVVVIAAAGALTAVTIPAFAGTDRSGPSPLDPPELALDLAPELLAAMERDLDLTEEQALARLQREAWAGQTITALRGELAEQYGGAWLSSDAEQLMVAVTDETAADKVRAAGAEPRLVSRGWAELERATSTLDTYAEQAAEAAVTGWYVHAATNSVVVHAPGWAEADAAQFAAATGAAAEAVRVVATDEQPRLLNDVRGGDPYVIAGAALCSIGFSVVGGFVTAGHCALAGTTTTDLDGQPQGEFVAASFPGVGLGGPDDWGVVAVNDDWTPQPVVNDHNGGTLPVVGAAVAPVGASVCRYGNTTGFSCGLIEATNATVLYPEGTVTGLTRTSACAEPGDSGGSWLSGDQAQGVTSGGSGDCTVGGTTFFQPLAEILELNELTLVTTGGAAAPAGPEPDEDPPPAAAQACDRLDFSFRGNVWEPGEVQIQPNGRYYQALAPGSHTVCLAGPSQANLDLALQQWDGQDWQAVAEATGPSANELILFEGPAGFYRIVVSSATGTGRYLVGLGFTTG